MLSEDLGRIRSQPGPAVLAFAGGALLGALAAVIPGVLVGGSSRPAAAMRSTAGPSLSAAQPRQASRPVATSPPAPPPAAARDEWREFRAALEGGVARARRYGGTISAAVWVDGWREPVVVGDDVGARLRLWSMSKPITAIAVREVAAGQRPVPAALPIWMEAALTRSENCAQRQMVVALQDAAGGPAGARAAFLHVLRQAAANAIVPGVPAPPELPCAPYRANIQGTAHGEEAPALLLGTAVWTIRDAVAFAHALGAGVYGSAGREVVRLMARPKQRSREQQLEEFTAPLNWGAGAAFAGWDPAYKAGWGGTRHGDFLAGQYAVVSHGGRTIAVAAVFRPSQQPTLDDPGRTAAPEALDTVFVAVRDEAARRFGR